MRMRGVHIMLHNERKKRYSMAQVRNEGMKGTRRQGSVSYGGRRRKKLFYCWNAQKSGGERSSWTSGHLTEEIALRKLLTANNATELRNLGAVAYKSKCKWQLQLEKTEPKLEGG
jgi:hypothetical protein